FYAGGFLQRLRVGDDLVEMAIGLGEAAAFRRDIAVVKTPEWGANFLKEFKSSVHADLRDRNRVGAFFPRTNDRTGTKWICPHAAKRVPVGNREAHVRAHRLAVDNLIGVIVAKSQRIGRTGAFVSDGIDPGKMRTRGFHSVKEAALREVGIRRQGESANRRILLK